MKMKRFVTAAVALLLMVSLVGTGFSYWFFNNNTTSTASTDLTKSVTQLIEVGSITAAGKFELKFDQATEPTTSSLTKYTANGIKAVFASTATEKDKKATYTSPTGNSVDTVSGQVTYDFIVTMTISEDLAKYFTATTSQSDWTASKQGNKITFTGNEQTEFDWDQVTFSYDTVNKISQEPTSKDELDKLRTAVNNGTISVVYTVTLRDVTTTSNN